jgi:hypothetical protein
MNRTKYIKEQIVMHPIPLMTHPLSIYWKQPDRKSIEIDGEYALMNEESFKLLPEYSSTLPSGIYDGKMWKCNSKVEGWLLGWYATCEDPNYYKTCAKKIKIIGGNYEVGS